MKNVLIVSSLLITSLLTFAGPVSSKELRPASKISAKAGPGEAGGGLAHRASDGRLNTLAEAGVIFKRATELGSKIYPSYYEISRGVERELKEIYSKLPEFKTRIGDLTEWDSVLGSRTTFIDQKAIDPVDYEKIKSAYKKALEKYQKNNTKKVNDSALVLAAYSIPFGKTYILPAFDKELTEKQQALYLIHEYFMRQALPKEKNAIVHLEQVLNLDAVIWDILQNGITQQSKLEFYEALYPLGGISKYALGKLRLSMLEEKLGRPIALSELVANPSRVQFIGYDVFGTEMDPQIIQKLSPHMPAIAERFEGWEIWGNYVRETELEKFLASKKLDRDSMNSFSSTKAKPDEEWLELYTEKRRLMDIEVTRINKLCTDYAELISRYPGDGLVTSSGPLGWLSVVRCYTFGDHKLNSSTVLSFEKRN